MMNILHNKVVCETIQFTASFNTHLSKLQHRIQEQHQRLSYPITHKSPTSKLHSSLLRALPSRIFVTRNTIITSTPLLSPSLSHSLSTFAGHYVKMSVRDPRGCAGNSLSPSCNGLTKRNKLMPRSRGLARSHGRAINTRQDKWPSGRAVVARASEV